MRRPITLNYPAKASEQKGFALFIVLMIMIVIALLVVTATQSYNTEQRISTNDADHKFATTLAEAALREGENYIYEIEDGTRTFDDNCTNGLCKAKSLPATKKDAPYTTATGKVIVTGNSTQEAWYRGCGKDEENKDKVKCIDVNGRKYPDDENSGAKKSPRYIIAKKPPRYIIEYLSTNSTDNRTIYRVTAKAWGKNENTVVMLQSYVANE